MNIIPTKLKQIFWICLLLVPFAIGGCEKNDDTILWVFYDETQCRDPWGASGIIDKEKKKNITAYFAGKGIKILDVKFSKGHTHPACVLCVCTTGTAILCKIKKDNLSFMEGEGFVTPNI